MNRMMMLYRWLPLIIGPLLVSLLSFAITWPEANRFGWSRSTYRQMSLSTAAGPFAGITRESSAETWAHASFYGALLAWAMLAYSIHPTRGNRCVTWLGFILWLLLGYAGTRVGV